jgi:glycosyltransferase involved in cell wall biosynthesis
MVAARLLGIGFSMTLHGSDLLLHAAYLDTKLKYCRFCVTVSDYNRNYILEKYPQVRLDKVSVRRLGVDPLYLALPLARAEGPRVCRVLLAVGRLHAVKDHAFLIRACRRLKDQGLSFLCLIAGEGPERPRLERLIAELDLHADVRLLGHVAHETLDSYYAMADVVVLTSRSEGIPLTLMEAMAQGRPVLAPAITGIPELVVNGKTGFLYQPGSVEDFVHRLKMILAAEANLESLCRAARRHVLEHFNRKKNLAVFGDDFLARITDSQESESYEDLVLQQI